MAPKFNSTSLGPILGLLAGVAVGSVGTLLLTSRRFAQALRSKRQIRSRDALADDSFVINWAFSQRTAFNLPLAKLKGNVEIGKLPLCHIFLCDDSRFPGWLILVPRKIGLVEVIDLTEEGQEALWKEVASASRVLQRVYEPKKLNISAIGNQTRQLHIHVSARNADDVAWPNVHLNASGRTYFAPEELQQHRQYLIQAFQEEETYFVAEED